MENNADAKARSKAKPHRWKPGESGNPAGTKRGSRHRASLLAESLLDGETDRLDAPQPGALILHIEELNLGIFSSGFSGSGFILYNTDSLPVRIPQIRPLSAEITRMNIPRLLQHWGA
jgi:hypothetical protein